MPTWPLCSFNSSELFSKPSNGRDELTGTILSCMAVTTKVGHEIFSKLTFILLFIPQSTINSFASGTLIATPLLTQLSIAKNSGVGIIIDESCIPISDALIEHVRLLKKDISDYKWHSGEDYQLLIALSPESAKKALSQFALTAIGRVTKDSGVFVTHNGQKRPLTEVGWDPFHL